MKTKTYTTIARILNVSGRTWSGHKGVCVYPLTANQSPKTLSEAKRIAGDFESLTSAVIQTTEQKITETVTSQVIALHSPAVAGSLTDIQA